jgi:hypothetical protein
MFATPLPTCQEPGAAGSSAYRFLWSPQGKATRRQWWLGHLSAAMLAGLGCLGATSVVLPFAIGFGLDGGGLGCRLIAFAVAALCLSQWLAASNALSRRRLSERGERHDLADAFLVMATIEITLLAHAAAQSLIGAHWLLPAVPHWLGRLVPIMLLGSFVGLALECGVFERQSLTEIWRGRSEWRVASGE